MFKNILCAIDGSEHALKAAEVASTLAARFDARLTFLTVTRQLKITPELKHYLAIENLAGEPQYILDEYTEQILATARDKARAAGLTKVKTEIREGQPARAIVAFAERSKADTIVLGSRGLGDIEGVLLGSVSHKVATLAKSTVITVK